MSTLRITLVRSLIGCTKEQRRTVRSLGLRRIRHSVERPDRPDVRGMVRAVQHLVRVEGVPGGSSSEAIAPRPDEEKTP